jgi:aminopeptidase-like protein
MPVLKNTTIDINKTGTLMYELVAELYPFCRSITGNGVRQTLNSLQKHIPVRIHEVPSGTKAFDWEVPLEWNIEDAFIKNSKGEKIIDFKKSNLHVLNYSIPVNKKVGLEELKKHVFTLPRHPDWIPYRTSYYQENWGFCMSHNQLNSLADDTYEVYIDSSLEKGSLTYGEYYIKGEKEDEILISTHICHPSLCNDNLSGIAVSTFLAKITGSMKNRCSYRFLFIPGTIGSIVWLSKNEKNAGRIKHGIVATLLGDDSDFTYKRSRRGNAEIDKTVEYYLKSANKPHKIIDFIPYGYDERQYCSPAFNLPVGCLTRKPHGEFPEYHTSADNMDFVKPHRLAESLTVYFDIIDILENNSTYINLNPKCEPQLGKRGLYEKIGGTNETQIMQMAALWILNLSDGNNSLLDIAIRSGIEFGLVKRSADALVECSLLKEHAGK